MSQSSALTPLLIAIIGGKKKKLRIAGPYSKEEIRIHNKENDVWIVVDNKVYDITDFVHRHPGGDSILKHAGDDATEGFKGPQHPVSVWDVISQYYIGDLLVEESNDKIESIVREDNVAISTDTQRPRQ
eukprot:gene17654-23237_t